MRSSAKKIERIRTSNQQTQTQTNTQESNLFRWQHAFIFRYIFFFSGRQENCTLRICFIVFPWQKGLSASKGFCEQINAFEL